MSDEPAWDQVFSVDDFYDGMPLSGVANYRGRPYAYRAEYTVQGETGRFFLTPIDDELLSLVIENWEIWLRWVAGLGGRGSTFENHPALPADRQRYEEIKRVVGDRLEVDSAHARLLRAEWDGGDFYGGPHQVKVRWHESE